jgi:hypothetical protein
MWILPIFIKVTFQKVLQTNYLASTMRKISLQEVGKNILQIEVRKDSTQPSKAIVFNSYLFKLCQETKSDILLDSR